VEAGELNTENNLLWLAQKLILQINKNSLVTDKQLISDKFPIARDLLPIYNFLKNNNDQIINISDMVEMNNNLLSYQPTLPTTNTVLTTIVGETVSTISGYKIGARINYGDGELTSEIYTENQPGIYKVIWELEGREKIFEKTVTIRKF